MSATPISMKISTVGSFCFTGLIFVGCLLIGLAIGIFTGQIAVVLLSALGVGFIGMAIMRYLTGAW